MIYATNSSFRLVEHLEFIKMISDLRPGYNPPNRIDIGAKLLDLVYKNSITRCSGMLHEQTVTMSIDGWSHWRSHRMGCTGPDPTNFRESNMGPAQNCVAKYKFTRTWTLPFFHPRRCLCIENRLPSISEMKI